MKTEIKTQIVEKTVQTEQKIYTISLTENEMKVVRDIFGGTNCSGNKEISNLCSDLFRMFDEECPSDKQWIFEQGIKLTAFGMSFKL